MSKNVAIRIAAAAICVAHAPLLAQPHAHAAHTATEFASRPSRAATSAALHMRTTELTAPTPADSVRVAALTAAVRRGIARYADVRVALRDGYKPIFVGDTAPGQVLHYTSVWRGMQEGRRLDPEKPGSLLYEKQGDGSLRLVGAMFGAPQRSTLAQLNERVPLSYAQWHLHTDMCTPRPIWDKQKWAQTLADGQPVFGPGSPIATRDACARVGGDFRETTFGWMVHAMVVDSAPLREVWGGHGAHQMDGMATSHPPVLNR